MLIRLIYVSTSQDAVDIHEFKRILLQAQTNNQRRDLTGMLAFNSKIFLQALEGARDQVNDLYGRLIQDKRHHTVTMLKYEEVEERRWADWSMGFAAPNSDNRALFLKYSQRSTFDPYGITGDAAEKMLADLAGKTIAMNAPAVVASPPPVQAPAAPAPRAKAPAEQGLFARFLNNR